MPAAPNDRNEVRIIAGTWRGRRLRFPGNLDIRPTPDRVRETLFNWLGQDLTGLRCLDLFAGSGALGFEALSRNASHVTFVDRSRAVIRHLEATAALLQATRAEHQCCDAIEFPRRHRHPEPFDVVFLDPPYGMGLVDAIVPRLSGRVAPDARLYFEGEAEPVLPEGWTIIKSGRAGQVRYGLATRGNA